MSAITIDTSLQIFPQLQVHMSGEYFFRKLGSSMINKSKTHDHGIWLLIDSRNSGGIESHILQLAKGLHDFKEKVTVIFLTNYGKHPLRNALKENGIHTFDLDGHIISLYRVAREKRPSVIHTHGYKAGIFGRIVARLCKIPLVSTYHAGEIPSGKMALYDWLDRQSARLASMVFAVSPQIAKRLPVDAKVIDNFVATKDLDISDGNEVAFVGRLSPEKGADYFLDLANRLPDIQFHIYGDGKQLNILKERAGNNTCFHGQQDDMASIWPRIALLVMPSRHEGLPMAALEAMARGIPVLASDVGALDKLIQHDSNGWLTKPGDIDQLKQYLAEWLNMTKTERQGFKFAAREQVLQRFSSEIIIPELIERYHKLAY